MLYSRKEPNRNGREMLSQTTIKTHKLTINEANELFDNCRDRVEYEQGSISMFGKTFPVPRLTAWFGEGSYSYSTITHEPKAMPYWLEQLKEKVELVANTKFNCALINFYRDGSDSVSWHSDDEPEFGGDPIIASVSVGAQRTFKLKHKQDKSDKASINLENGTILVMGEGCQPNYLHCVPKTKKAVLWRFNITFRNQG